ncbi:MFS transporter [Chloroflexota bacterium]
MSGARDKGFRGWIVAAGLALSFFSVCGCYGYSFGVLLPRIIEETGWLWRDTSWAFAIHTVVFSLIGPLVGWLIVKVGARRNFVFGHLFIVIGLIGMSFSRELWHVYLTYGVVGGLGLGFGGLLTMESVISNWFIRRRSFVFGMVIAAGGVGGFAFPHLIGWMLTGGALDWRESLLVLAGIHLLLAVVISGSLARGKPADVGQVADGGAAGVVGGEKEKVSSSPRAYHTPVDWEPGLAMRQPATWLIMIMVILNLFVSTIIQVHQVAYLEDVGFTQLVAAGALGFVLGFSVLGRLGFGTLALRFPVRYLIAAFFALRVIALVILINAGSVGMIYLYVALSGLAYGGLYVFRPVILGAYYGASHYPRIAGWVALVGILGALGSVAAGAVRDILGEYLFILYVAMGLSVLGIICALLARPPRHPALK